MSEALHQIVGYVSAVAYFICTLIALVAYSVYQLWPLLFIANLHMAAVILASFSISGIVYWYVMENFIHNS